MAADRCIVCNEIVPEGYQICPIHLEETCDLCPYEDTNKCDSCNKEDKALSMAAVRRRLIDRRKNN